jgi:hypothetical protein
MVMLSKLRAPSVRHRQAGVEPGERALNGAGAAVLHRPPAPTSGSIRLASDWLFEVLQQSPVAGNALILLHETIQGPGYKMMVINSLSRRAGAEMCELSMWPDFDKDLLENI